MGTQNASLRKLAEAACLIAWIIPVPTTQAFAQSGTWTTKAPMPTPRSTAAVGVVDSIAYVAGGESASGRLATMEAYDPKTNTWTTKPSMPTARCCAGAAAVDGNLYVVGGGDASFRILSTVEAFSPEANTWTMKAPMPTPRGNLAVVAVNGVLYAIGGFEHYGGMSTTMEAYDQRANGWLTKAWMPTGRCCMAAGVVGGLIYVAGGITAISPSGGVSTTAGLEVYDPETDTWEVRTPTPTIRAETGAGVLDGLLYVVGGTISPGRFETVQSTTEVYDPKTDSWSTQSPMPTRRARMAATVLDGTLYVIGGLQETGAPVSLNEAFRPFLAIGIDIKPGDPNNVINLGSAGTVPAAILGSATFDPTTVDPATVTLAGATATTRGGVPITSVADVNHDGYLDLVLRFRTRDLQLTPSDTEAVLRGQTFSGQLIRGADAVRVVPFQRRGRAAREDAPNRRN